MNPRRLYRSRDRQLAGVAGGMAEYLDIDPTVIRILWILAAIVSAGFAILAYIVLAIVIPQNPYAAAVSAPGGYPAYGPAGNAQPGYQSYAQPGYPGYAQAGNTAGAGAAGWAAPPPSPAWSPDWAARAAAEAQTAPRARGGRFGAAAIVGVVLIVIGAIALADAAFPGWSGAAVLGPAVIIALGAAFLVASVRRQDEPVAMPATPVTPADETGRSSAPGAPASNPLAQSADPVSTDDSTDTQPVGPTPFV